MLAPQSDEEIRPIVEGLKQLDQLLDVRWNPEAIIVAKGSYSALGKRVNPVYDGRWDVIRYDSPTHGHAGVHPDRGFTVICTVTEPKRENGILFMVPLREGGRYAPLGDWLLEFMRQSDAQNVNAFTALRQKLWAESDRAERAEDAINEGAVREALDHNHFHANYAGGVGNWQGKGADWKDMAAKAARVAEARAILGIPTR